MPFLHNQDTESRNQIDCFSESNNPLQAQKLSNKPLMQNVMLVVMDSNDFENEI